MSNGQCSVYYSEANVRVQSGAFTPATGTLTLASVTVTLRDNNGAVAGGISATPLVQGTNGGWDVGASAGPIAWFFFTPGAGGLSLPVPVAPDGDLYTLEFLATDTESPAGSYESVVVVKVLADGT